MADSRIDTALAVKVATYYVMANCRRFENSSDESLEDWESDLLSLVRSHAEMPVPFFARDKQTKLTLKDIGSHTLFHVGNLSARGWTKHARSELRKGVNAILRVNAGPQLFAMIEDKFSIALDVEDDPVHAQPTSAHGLILRGAMQGMVSEGIRMGLVSA